MTIKCIETSSDSEEAPEFFLMKDMEKGSVAYCPERDSYVLRVTHMDEAINLVVKGKEFSSNGNSFIDDCSLPVRKIRKDEIITLELS